MTGTTISGAYVTGVVLSDAATNNPVSITNTAVIGNATGAGVQGTGTLDWIISNSGTVRSTGTSIGSTGIALAAGGTITNQAAALIGGNYAGVAMYAAGTVVNGGSIGAQATVGRGIFLAAGGAVVNGTGAKVTGGNSGVSLTTSGVVVNSGTISGLAGYGVALAGGGAVTNNSASGINGYTIGVSLGGAGTVVNAGSVGSVQTSGTGFSYNSTTKTIIPITGGIVVNQGGGVSNAATGTVSSNFFGIAMSGGGSVVNAGSVSAASTVDGFGVLIQGGGSATNAASGTISAGLDGIVAFGTQSATVTNFGAISGTARSGIDLFGPGSVINAASGSITGNNIGILTRGLADIVNAGSIITKGGSISRGILMVAGGAATNAATGTIASTNIGVYSLYVAATVTNLGQISSTRTFAGAGVQLKSGGTVVNGAGGTISAEWIGAQIGGFNYGTISYAPGGTVLNQGLIFASDGTNGAAVWIKGAGVILNSASGTISGGPYGVVSYDPTTIVNAGSIGGTQYAVFAANAGIVDRVVVAPGAQFSGIVAGSNVRSGGTAVGVLELQAGGSGSIAGFGSKYVGFSQVTLDAGGAWSLGGTVAAAQTLAFAGANATLTLANPDSVAGTIAGFAATDTIDLAGITDVTSATLGVGNLLTVTQSAGPNLTLQFDPAQSFTGTNFGFSVSGGSTALVVPCFARGTHIRTGRGAIAVEHLEVGDLVVNPWGETLPIVWLGHRRVDCRRHRAPADVLPVLVRTDAFAAGQPLRDLVLSPDHAVFVDGDLIPVRYLVNGISVVRLEVAEVEYWHVELERHDVLLAEGLPVESYLDTGNRDAFAGGPATAAHADFAVRALEVWDSSACGRLMRGGAALAAVKQLLLDRLPPGALADDPDLHLLADGVRIDARRLGSRHEFTIPNACRSLRLTSRAAIPAEVWAGNDDPRLLGAAVRSIELDGEAMSLTDPRLGAGWQPREGGSRGWRWTDGHAVLPACRSVTVTLAPLLRYPVAIAEARRQLAL